MLMNAFICGRHGQVMVVFIRFHKFILYYCPPHYVYFFVSYYQYTTDTYQYLYNSCYVLLRVVAYCILQYLLYTILYCHCSHYRWHCHNCCRMKFFLINKHAYTQYNPCINHGLPTVYIYIYTIQLDLGERHVLHIP